MSELERKRENMMESTSDDLPFGRSQTHEERRTVWIWVTGILLALAIPIFYIVFGLVGAMFATSAAPVAIFVLALFAVSALVAGFYAYSRIRLAKAGGTALVRDDVGNIIGGDSNKVSAIMRRDPVVAGTLDSVYDAAKLMYKQNVGFLVVLDAQDRCVGVVTDRDLVCGAIAQGADPMSMPLSVVMQSSFISISPEESIEECLRLMESEGVRRLPVLEQGMCVGIISIDDLIIERRCTLEQAALILRTQMAEPRVDHDLKPRVSDDERAA